MKTSVRIAISLVAIGMIATATLLWMRVRMSDDERGIRDAQDLLGQFANHPEVKAMLDQAVAAHEKAVSARRQVPPERKARTGDAGVDGAVHPFHVAYAHEQIGALAKYSSWLGCPRIPERHIVRKPSLVQGHPEWWGQSWIGTSMVAGGITPATGEFLFLALTGVCA